MNINDFARRKVCGEKLSMVTCYDFWSAQILNQTDVDSILVGDSLAMVMHGFPSTVHATVDMMATHIAAVRRGCLLYTSPSPRDVEESRMPSSA